jgi:hypothetical protein
MVMGMGERWGMLTGDMPQQAEPFKKPVTKREAPDYHTVIKRPMALNDVKKKVDKNEYKVSATFVREMTEGEHNELRGDMHLPNPKPYKS